MLRLSAHRSAHTERHRPPSALHAGAAGEAGGGRKITGRGGPSVATRHAPSTAAHALMEPVEAPLLRADADLRVRSSLAPAPMIAQLMPLPCRAAARMTCRRTTTSTPPPTAATGTRTVPRTTSRRCTIDGSRGARLCSTSSPCSPPACLYWCATGSPICACDSPRAVAPRARPTVHSSVNRCAPLARSPDPFRLTVPVSVSLYSALATRLAAGHLHRSPGFIRVDICGDRNRRECQG